MQSAAFLTLTALKATIVLAAAFLIAAVLRRASASARYLLWTAALAAVLAIPIFSVSLRPWNVAVTAHSTAIAAIELPAAPTAPEPAPGPARWVFALWLCGAALVAGRAILGHWRVRLSLRRAAVLRDPAWQLKLAETCAAIGLRRPVVLRRGAETEVPISYGLLSPVILLPAQSEEWSDSLRGVVLLHELTHIRRFDWLACLISQLACAIYWFHPLAWLAATRLRREQERSCDDAVVTAGTPQSEYAEHLLALAGSLSHSAMGMAEASGLELRVRALLDPNRKRHSVNRRACAVAAAALLACAIPFAIVQAQDSGPRAGLNGTVYDPSGASIPNASVLLKNLSGKGQEIARSNAAGEYHFDSIPASKYEVEVNARGFARYRLPALDLTANPAAQADFHLEIGAISETLDVVAAGQPAPMQRSSAHTGSIAVGGSVQATKLVRQVSPVYPPSAQAAGIEGTVLLQAIVSKQGTLSHLTALNSVDPQLVQAAIDAVQQWTYQPTLLNGQPVQVVTTITVNFNLRQ